MAATAGDGIFFKKEINLQISGKNEKTKQKVVVEIKRLKNLEIQLTMESNPLFLYYLSFGEEEFHAIKTAQTLLIDYNQFPSKVVELLEMVIDQSSELHPKFTCILDHHLDGWKFSIVEANSFKNITHLCLDFTPGDDATTKNYLAGVVKDLKEERFRTNSVLNATKDSLEKYGNLLSQKQIDLDQQKLEFQKEISKLNLDHAQALALEKENWIKKLEDFRISNESDGKGSRMRYEEQIKSLNDQLNNLQSIHSTTVNTASTLENSLKAAENKISSLNREISGFNQERERLVTSKLHLEENLATLHKNYDQLSTKLVESQRMERAAVEKSVKLEDKLEFQQSHLQREESMVNELKTQNQRLEMDLKGASEEIQKANEIIRKLQGDLKGLKSKLKLKNVVTLQQEKLLEEKGVSMDVLTKEIETLRDQAKKQASESQDSTQKIAELTKALEDARKVIDDNNHVIDWLHKQLNEDAVGRPLSKPFAPIDFNKYSSLAKADVENLKPLDRNRYSSVESAGAFERSSPVPQIPLGVSRVQSTYSSHTLPSRTKSPTNSSYQHFNVSTGKHPLPSGIPKIPKSNYFGNSNN